MSDELFDLAGKAAVITGGGGVLGGVMAQVLTERGVMVAILDVREEAALAAAGILAASGGNAVGLACDVLDEASLARAAERILGEFGRLDILVNAAGGNAPAATTSKETAGPDDLLGRSGSLRTFFDLGIDDLRRVLDLNLLGTLLPCRVLGLEMARLAAPDQGRRLLGSQGGRLQSHRLAGDAPRAASYPSERHRAGFLPDRTEPLPAHG
jgi:NAD(P)-dependent dehydrogenase (short-subunit alcohol dehydrogenase family)